MAKIKQNIDYGYDIQKLYLEIMLTDAETFIRCQSIFDSDLFDNKLKNAADFLNEFVIEHNAMPTFDMVNASTNSNLENPGPLQESHYDWLLSEFEVFSRHRALEKAILRSADLLEKSEYGQVEQIIKDAVQIGLQKDLGTNYWIDPRKRLEEIKNSSGQVSTGWKTLDKLLYGGMSRGELEIFAGSSGCVTGETLVDVIPVNDDNPSCQSIPIGDLYFSKNDYLVSSPDGFVPVIDCIKKDKSHMYKVTFSTGEVIHASDDHLFQNIDNTWIYARDLKLSEKVVHQNGVSYVSGITPYFSKTVVYDLSVDHKNHRYYTNGVCSHNSGKSLFLANLGINWVLENLNVLYITCELSENLVSMRIDSMLTGIGTREIFKRLDDIEMKITLLGKKSGALQIKYMPSGSTVNHIRSYLKEYEAKNNKKMDVLIVDYLDLVDPATKKISAENMFVKDKYVSEELRNLAMETNTIMVTASQLNRCLSLDTLVERDGETVPISQIKPGDHIASNEGDVQVQQVYPITKQPVYKIVTESGKEIVCSGNHEFPVGNELRSINNGLAVGDELTVKADYGEMYMLSNKIVKIIKLDTRETVDIEVSGNRLFYANGILTHNSGIDEIEYDHSNISGGLSKINTADNVFGIFTSRAMRERGEYQLQLMKTRSSSGVGSKVNFDFDINTLRITDPEKETSDDNQQQTPNQIADVVNRNSTNKGNVSSSGKGSTDSSKLREFLKNNSNT